VSGARDPQPGARFERPTREEFARYADEMGLPKSPEGFDESWSEIAGLLEGLGRLYELRLPDIELHHADRDPCRRPTESEDPFNAIIWLCSISGASAGPLSRVRVGIKDNIAVAGVPMTGGETRDVIVPSRDAVVIERLLEAGAVITAKTNTAVPLVGSPFGVTRNPCDSRFSPGFSSSGSAAAVAARLVDMALGTDLAGSVRIPSAWCGTVGMKATHGLIPSAYGVGNHLINDIGPITTTVADSALILETLAAADTNYLAAATDHLKGLRIGLVAQSADPSVCTAGTRSAFEQATARLEGLGAELVGVSVPLWGGAAVIVLGLLHLSQIACADHWLGEDADYEGWIDEGMVASLAANRSNAQDVRIMPLIGEHFRRQKLGGSDYARARNLRWELRRQLNLALSEVDLLVTPTTVAEPFELSDERLADPEATRRLLELSIRNTAPLNLSGHPALTVPSGPGANDLPTGIQIVGRHFEEHTVYRAGLAFEAGRTLASPRHHNPNPDSLGRGPTPDDPPVPAHRPTQKGRNAHPDFA
jgi:amidase